MTETAERLLIKQQIAASRMILMLLERYQYDANEKDSRWLLTEAEEKLSRATDNLSKYIHQNEVVNGQC